MKSKKYSFIIPVYNGEKTIERCLNSILEQRCSDYEIIVINDGSTDRTKKIIESYKTVKLINVPNGGQGKARNFGMKNATGKYILFVDADDYIDNNLLFNIDNIVDKNDYDIIKFKYKIESGSHNFIEENLINVRGGVVANCTKFLSKKYYFSIDSAYRKDFLIKNKVLFGEGYIYEDYQFWLKACINAQKGYYLTIPLYTIVKNDESSTNSQRKTSIHYDSFNSAMNACKKIVKEENIIENINYFYRYLLNRFLSYYQKRIPSSLKKPFLKSFVDDMNQFDISTFHNKNYDILLKYDVLKKKKYLFMRLYCYLYIIKNYNRK